MFNTQGKFSIVNCSKVSYNVKVKKKEVNLFPGKQLGVGTSLGRKQIDQQCCQLLFYLVRKVPQDIIGSAIVNKLLIAADQQILSQAHVTLTSFFDGFRATARQIMAARGNIPSEIMQIDAILAIFQKGYKEEMCKSQLLRDRYGLKCTFCQTESTTSSPLLPCNGECLRTFHLSCALNNPKKVQTTQIGPKTVSVWGILCEDCAKGCKILRWDATKKLHFYLEFSHAEEPTKLTTQPDPPLVIDEETTKKGTKIIPGTGVEPALILNEPQEPLVTEDLLLPENVPTKQQLRQEEKQQQNRMWYDPIWCTWRYKSKEGLLDRKHRQNNRIKVTDELGDIAEEPPTKKQKIV